MQHGPYQIGVRRQCLSVMLTLAVLLCLATARGDDVEHNLEALIGHAAAQLLAEEFGTLDNPLLDEWIRRVGVRVAASCPRQEFPFRFRVLDCPEPNAYALPGAHIFVTRGLLAEVQSDDELAGVLAHEVGHIADRDFQRMVARQLMFLGLREGLSLTDQDSLIPALYVVQLLNTLRHSRRQEDQADVRAVEYTLRARYDPTAITAFYDLILGGRRKPREWYEGVLQTHPDAYRRRQRCLQRAERLAKADYDAFVDVLYDLRARYRYSAALGIAQVAHSAWPQDVRPLIAEAEIRLARGERDACLAACRQGLLISPADERLLKIALEANDLNDPPDRGALVSESGAKVSLDLPTFRRLKQVARSLADDRRFAEALTWAQAYRPEINDWRWVYLFVRIQVLLQVADRLRWRVVEIARLAEQGKSAWEDAGDPEATARATNAYAKSVKQGIEAGEELRTAMWLLTGALSSLVASGAGEPLGAMNSARFGLLEADLFAAERQLRKALRELRVAARDIALAEVERHTCALNRMWASADQRQRAIYWGLASARLYGVGEGVAPTSDRLGRACQEAVMRECGVAAGSVPTYAQAETARIVLRLLTCEAKAETIGTTATVRQ